MSHEVKRARPPLQVLTEDLRGRPLRLDLAALLRYVALLKAGGFHTPSANTVGMDPDTIGRYRRRGEVILRRQVIPWPPGDTGTMRDEQLRNLSRVLCAVADPRSDPELVLAGFAWACIEAEGESESSLLLLVRKGAVERPELALKLLERRYPDRWGAPKPSMSAQVSAGPGGASASFVVYVPAEVEP